MYRWHRGVGGWVGARQILILCQGPKLNLVGWVASTPSSTMPTAESSTIANKPKAGAIGPDQEIQPVGLGHHISTRSTQIRQNLAVDRPWRRKLPTTRRCTQKSRICKLHQKRRIDSILRFSCIKPAQTDFLINDWSALCDLRRTALSHTVCDRAANRLRYSNTTEVTHTKWWSFWPYRMMELYNWRCRMHEVSLRKPYKKRCESMLWTYAYIKKCIKNM